MTWEPEENVKNAQEKIAEYYRHVEGNDNLKGGEWSVLDSYSGILFTIWMASDGYNGIAK